MGFLNFLCVAAIIASNIVFIIYAINMVIPYLGTSLKVYIIDNYDKLPKPWIIKKLKKSFDRKEASKKHWRFITKNVHNFVKLIKDEDLKKFNKIIIFYNNSNEEMINDLKIGKIKF